MSSRNETELSVGIKNGSIITLKGADNPESLKGVGLAGVVLDEYAFMRPHVWEEIIRPMLFDQNGWAYFISTPKGYNHFYDLWESVADKENWDRFHFTTYDNPHITREEIEEAKASMSQERFSQEIMAEFIHKSGAIWPMFSRDLHVTPRRNPSQSSVVFGSIDFGYAIGHPTCVGWHEVNGEEVYTFDGFLREQMTIEEIDHLMRSQTNGLTVRGIFHPKDRPDLAEELRRRGWNMLEANQDVELGVAKVAEYFQVNPMTNRPRYGIAEHLTGIIRQYEEYEWEEVRGSDGQFKQVPKKENDDGPDMVRYFLFNYQNKPNNQNVTIRPPLIRTVRGR